jgi:hypothetical protein
MRLLIPAVMVVGFAVVTINGYKNYYRESIRRTGLETGERVGLTADAFVELIKSPGRVTSPQSLSYSVSRLNQGWVTTRALAWTPRVEPFAHGETVLTAIRAAIVPRLLDSEKYEAGGKYNTPRFTGIQLYNETSINLSIPGEMYVNFGVAFGTVGVFIYGLFIGWLFSLFVRWSRASQLWWAWAPYLLYSSLSAEGGLGETLNQITKSAVVMFAVIAVAPGWSQLRARGRSQRPSRATVVGSLPPGVPR